MVVRLVVIIVFGGDFIGKLKIVVWLGLNVLGLLGIFWLIMNCVIGFLLFLCIVWM